MSDEYLLCRMVESGDSLYVSEIYDRYFLIDLSDLGASGGSSIDAPEAETVDVGGQEYKGYGDGNWYATQELANWSYLRQAYKEFQNMWNFIAGTGSRSMMYAWSIASSKEEYEDVQEQIWNRFFAAGGFLDTIGDLLISGGELSSKKDTSGTYAPVASWIHNHDYELEDAITGTSYTKWTMYESYSTVSLADENSEWVFAKTSNVEEYEARSYYGRVIDTDWLDGTSDGDKADICLLGHVIMKHFDKSGSRWNDYISGAKDSIRDHFDGRDGGLCCGQMGEC